MLPPPSLLRLRLATIISDQESQGHVVDGLRDELAALPPSYDALAAFSQRLVDLPLRPEWPYDEPSDWEGIAAAADPGRALGPIAEVDPSAMAAFVEAAFAASLCGCVLGKPVEVNPTLDELQQAAEASQTPWPFVDYIDDRFLDALGRRHVSWTSAGRSHLTAVPPDDDINYTLIGMLALERKGSAFTQADLADLWFRFLPLRYCCGPERTQLIKTAYASLAPHDPFDPAGWADHDNPGDEFCGALIRADAYGYACPGDPALAVQLAWRDASWTHRRTGIYGALYVAAAIATAFVIKDPLKIFRLALGYVPQSSRFHQITADCLEMVAAADDWESAYRRINDAYGQYTHGRIYQEIGTMINAVTFARDTGHGIALQVAQGNDTDSFGATAGSILGALHGPGGLDPAWLAPFKDRVTLGMAGLGDDRLSVLTRRIGRLPRICRSLALQAPQENAEGMALDPATGLPLAPAFH